MYKVLLEFPRENGFDKSNWTMTALKQWINEKFGINYTEGEHVQACTKAGIYNAKAKNSVKMQTR